MTARDDDRPLPLSPRWIEGEAPPADMPPPVEPRAMRQRTPPGVLALLLLLVFGVLGGTAIALWIAFNGPRDRNTASPDDLARTVSLSVPAPEGKPPEVAPVTYLAVPPEEARVINAKVPFFLEQAIPARPFILSTTGETRERAITCLAAANYYEAGNDPIGMAAVAQVVLNRVRHPAFPSSVCGVVFQGAARRTGCQFTFACDGALARVPVAAIWERARAAATLALTGFVFRPVGQATHYHTDWVVPYWGPKLVKIAQVHTHLFFRWPGGWGGPGAFHQGYAGEEAIDPRIAGMMTLASPPTLAAPEIPTDASLTGSNPVATNTPQTTMSPEDLRGSTVRGYDPAQASFILQLDPAGFPGDYALVAFRLCKDRTPCRVAGWRNPAEVPSRGAITDEARRTASFLYEKLGPGSETSRWNCRETPRSNPTQCIAPAN